MLGTAMNDIPNPFFFFCLAVCFLSFVISGLTSTCHVLETDLEALPGPLIPRA